ncbi:hypothetical protein ACFYZ4_32375 [Streptomyces sp. NPDC001513]|uniref:hypothetical protein n=1 Tax=Streptomyces sp. NPDC001513 TaxID=3364580 RepID=UPI0036949CAC
MSQNPDDKKAGQMHQKVAQLRASSTPDIAAYATACAEVVAINKVYYETTLRYTAPQPQPGHQPHDIHP